MTRGTQQKETTSATLSPSLSFDGNAEEAFKFYRSVFGGDFMGGGIMRYSEMPGHELAEEEKNKVMHVGLSVGKGSMLIGNDNLESMGEKLIIGNNSQILLSPDRKEEADRLFERLSEGGDVKLPMQDMFWGAYYGAVVDKFGVNWMVHYATGKHGDA